MGFGSRLLQGVQLVLPVCGSPVKIRRCAATVKRSLEKRGFVEWAYSITATNQCCWNYK